MHAILSVVLVDVKRSGVSQRKYSKNIMRYTMVCPSLFLVVAHVQTKLLKKVAFALLY